MRKVLPLKGYKSLRALNAFHTLLLGVKMLPAYFQIQYEEFYESFKSQTDAQKEALLREAVAFVQLSEEEVDAVVCFATDANGVPYTAVNKGNLGPDELVDVIVSVCMEIGQIKIDLVSEAEKKK